MRLGLIAASLLAACNGDDTTSDTDTDTGDVYSVLGDAENLPASAFLSIWGTGSGDVWTVGADDGSGPSVLHFDGSAWTRLDTSSSGDLWWVWSSGGDTVWMVGDGARVLRHDRKSGGVSEQVIANPAYKLFGIWGTADDDIFAVGGDINRANPGVVLHYDGKEWTEVYTAPGNDTVAVRLAFKVWGSGPSDVWVVGDGALLAHYDGKAWQTLEAPVFATSPLTTVHGAGPNQVYAVGGFGNAVVASFDGATWADDSPPPKATAPFFNGVFTTTDRGTVACGGSASIWWRRDGGWEIDPRQQRRGGDFHACWIDDTGGAWAVGGDLTSLDEGLIVYLGDTDIPVIAL